MINHILAHLQHGIAGKPDRQSRCEVGHHAAYREQKEDEETYTGQFPRAAAVKDHTQAILGQCQKLLINEALDKDGAQNNQQPRRLAFKIVVPEPTQILAILFGKQRFGSA